MSFLGQRIVSAPFRAGWNEWQLIYYPNGGSSSHGGHVAVDLTLTAGSWWRLFYYPRDVTAAYDMAKVEELRSTLRSRKDDDALVLRCDVTVMNLEKESRIKFYLRQLLK
ncbi:unnamed protein product [Urochloa humidicola]